MGRMERYKENESISYSRTKKNEDLYRDVYLNNTLIDFTKIIGEPEEEVFIKEETEELTFVKPATYIEKEYNISKYLEEKRALHQQDNLPRSLNEDLKINDNKIDELVLKIEQKEKEENIFNELMPDDGDTTTLIEGNNELNSFVSEQVIDNYIMNKDMDATHSFDDLEETNNLVIKKAKKKKSNKDLAIIVFCTIALILLGVIIYIVVKIF